MESRQEIGKCGLVLVISLDGLMSETSKGMNATEEREKAPEGSAGGSES